MDGGTLEALPLRVERAGIETVRRKRNAVGPSDALRVLDELQLQNRARGVRDAVGTDPLLQDPEFFEVVRIGEATANRLRNRLRDQLSELAAASRPARALSGVAQAELLRLAEFQQGKRLLKGERPRIAVALRYE